MELWHGDLPEFIEYARSSALVNLMTAEFLSIYKRRPQESELRSWNDSLAAVADVADEGAPSDDVGVAVEYHLPLSDRRIDVMFFGTRDDGLSNSLLVELKRWDSASLEDEFARNVLVGTEEHVHPSEQALDYAEFLVDTHSTFVEETLQVQPAAFCHEMTPVGGAALRDRRFEDLLRLSPLFIRGEEHELAETLARQVGHGGGLELMQKTRSGRFKPSKRIVESLVAILRHDEEWHLLDEQRLAFNAIWAEVERLRHKRNRSAVAVGGGPGTGKSSVDTQNRPSIDT